jgi:hypothetical protein
LPASKNPPAIGGIKAGEHFDQRAFARAVLAHQRVDLRRAQGKIDADPAPKRRETAW